jgi:thiosulfate dehydrogenase [quinone] large subunit
MSDGRKAKPAATATTGRTVMFGLLRLSIGFIFLWAFLDKCFGLGYATPSAKKWMFGTGDGNPTAGYLKFGVNPKGPFASFFHSLGETALKGGPNSWINWLFMLGLLGIGLGLMLGIAARITAVCGVVMLGFMYAASAPWAQYTHASGANQSNNPVVDEHLVYIFAILAMLYIGAQFAWGLAKPWEGIGFVKKFKWLH